MTDLTLGYIKDVTAFYSISSFMFTITLFKIKLHPKVIEYLFFSLLFLIILFDGVFTFNPELHNLRFDEAINKFGIK